ncbi:MAG TPA: hypothetical protein VNV60_07715 [Holophagaceae bacterium]|jgi:hypothetical protein|nr:hypothetical protein [Holophagaceae bacterium]
MVWKQDLAKLKQAFPEVGGPPPPPVKPKPKPVEVKDLNAEDAFFLAAMGAPAPRPPKVEMVAPPVQVVAPPAVEASFDAEILDLKGIKPLSRNPVLATPPAAVPSKVEAPPAKVEIAPIPEPAIAPVGLPVALELDPSRGPIRIHLAAGMAVEVDALLDLRNHSVPDALGRLRDRLEDGAHMGWRTLHVVLGEDEALRDALLALFTAGGSLRISRYAQAPIPMGGAQAWVLYY